MFRRTALALPAEPSTSAPFVRFDDAGRVKIADDPADAGQLYTFWKTSNERANELIREHMHDRVKAALLHRLTEYGMQQFYLHDKTFDTKRVVGVPTINIMATKLSKLKSAKDVIIVVGEYDQDLAVYDWVDFTSDGGLYRATAVGLADLIQSQAIHTRGRGPAQGVTDSQPAIVLLNPGQLIWSNQEQTNVSFETWRNRHKPEHVGQDHYEIFPAHNRVAGHASSEEHVTTFLDRILPQVTDPNVRLHFIAVGDGGETLISWLDAKLVVNPDDVITDRIAAMALIQCSLGNSDIHSSYMRNFCSNSYKVFNWVLSDQPLGTLLRFPELFTSREYVADTVNIEYHDHLVNSEQPAFRKYENYGITSGIRAVLASLEAFKWNVTQEPASSHPDIICGTMSGGEEVHRSMILPRLLPGILQWFDNNVATYEKLRDYLDVECPVLPEEI